MSVGNRGNRRITRVAEPHNIEYQEAKRNRALRAACWWSKVIGLHYTIICRATETTTDYVEVLKEVRGVEM